MSPLWALVGRVPLSKNGFLGNEQFLTEPSANVSNVTGDGIAEPDANASNLIRETMTEPDADVSNATGVNMTEQNTDVSHVTVVQETVQSKHFLPRALHGCCESELGVSAHTEPGVQMQRLGTAGLDGENLWPVGAALYAVLRTGEATMAVGNGGYRDALRCLREGRRHHLRHRLLKRRLTIPWCEVWQLKELLEHWEQQRDSAWASSEADPLNGYWQLPGGSGRPMAAVANHWIGLALDTLGC
ncbi:hypothetical protein CYMTET_31479 [Cymbomonas tetramitiformis]|uniref:Uncharacterized protein n=1 Tax=Cymbomonas tetramitiformis TaxID=36881 RepID=A0AAE0FHE9_9CHLO|nr:hypothetical protein CYMTET_31479 [Cymbomonas tetramitiformis]